MAYSLLGGVPPIVGIYMAFFPVLLYVLMGTSRHVSMGWYDAIKFIEIMKLHAIIIVLNVSLLLKGVDHPLTNIT
jgi:MFS superfamily sulfate permease-like transporter